MNTTGFGKMAASLLAWLIWISPCFSPIVNSRASAKTPFLVVDVNGDCFTKSFSSIQDAINQVENGSRIYVPSGVYRERVAVNKTVSLFGKRDLTALIDGGGGGTVVEITADDVTIEFFKIQNSGYGWMNHGIYVDTADNCTIRNNLLQNNCHTVKLSYSQNSHVIDNLINGTMTSPTMYGIRIENSTNCTIARNDVTDCVGAVHLQNASDCTVNGNNLHENSQGLRMYSPCAGNRFFENTVRDGTYDGMIDNTFGGSFLNNSFFRNSFINNTNPFIYKASGFSWNDGYPSGGNHWSRYNGSDSYRGAYQNETGSDGIGDARYPLNEYDGDRYPLVHPFGSIRNLDTNLTYHTIQSAVDSNETMNGHTIFVRSGTYEEHLTISKALALIGENQTLTIIDGRSTGTVVSVTADNVTLTGFTINSSGQMFPPYGNDCGVLLDHGTRANVSHNTMANNRIGIYVYYSEGNIIEHNTVHSNSEDGMLLWHSGSNALVQNMMLNNTRNFGVFGQEFRHFDNSVDESNTVDGRSIHYMIGVTDVIIDNRTDIGVLYLVNCANVTVRNMEFTSNSHGVSCFNVTDSKIDNVTSQRNAYGVSLQNSVNNTVNNNRLADDWVGIDLEDSDGNCVEGNTVEGGEKGISLYGADENTVKGNTFTNAFFGIRMYASSFNKAFHNNLIENTEQASVLSGSYDNTWDDGIEGNYWSDYTGQDSDKDGLGDGHYAIDSQNQDTHPLLGCFHAFTVSHNGNSHQVDVVANSTVLGFAYANESGTIRLTVNGSEQTFGFCRVRVPHALVEPELTVVIDDGLTQVLGANYTLFDDGSSRWVYFAYSHSTHEILIIPEFHFLMILWFVSASLFLLMFSRARKDY